MSQTQTTTATTAPTADQNPPTTTTTRQILFNKYEMGKLLGCGGFAKVYHARNIKTNQSVAIKSISTTKIKTSNLTAHVKREVAIMRRLRHPHIIHLHEVLATTSRIYFVMDFAKGGELFAKIANGRFSEDLSRRYFRQLISAVAFCHSHGVYHRDLKLENLLLDENYSLKLTDFGLSAANNHRETTILNTLCGTPAYVAPEILAKKGYDGAKVDIWSCGVILFVLNAGYLPFNDANLMNLYRKIYRGEYRCPKWMSPDLKRFLGRVLDTNPETRVTIEGIMEDPWFKKGGYKCNLVKMKWEEEGEIRGLGDNNNNKGKFLNAFDLIAFSPGFSLSGLFAAEVGRRREVFVAAERVERVVEEVERVVGGEEGVVVERVKGGMGVRVEGYNGHLGLVVEVYRLTQELVVVEVRMKEEDVGPSFDFWRVKLRPKISHLFYDGISSEMGRPNSNLLSGSSSLNGLG